MRFQVQNWNIDAVQEVRTQLLNSERQKQQAFISVICCT